MADELIAIEKETAELAFMKDDEFEKLFVAVKEKTAELVPDTTTVAGRKAIASMAYKVAKTKTAIDKVRENLTEDMRAKVKAIDAKGKVMRDRLDELRDSVRLPLNEWEEKEKTRVDAIMGEIERARKLGHVAFGATSADIQEQIDQLPTHEMTFYQEFADEAAPVLETAFNNLVAAKVVAENAEKERAEQARQREELEAMKRAEEIRIAKEREEREAAEAARLEDQRRQQELEAARLKKAQEEQAAIEQERQEAARRTAAAEQAAIDAKAAAEREIADAKAKAAQDIQDAKDAAERKIQEAKEAAEREAAEAKAEQERIAAEAQAKADALAEAERLAAEAAAKELADSKLSTFIVGDCRLMFNHAGDLEFEDEDAYSRVVIVKRRDLEIFNEWVGNEITASKERNGAEAA